MNKKAFTIIELLVVIVILGVLASIIIVSYANINSRATDDSLKMDLSNNSKVLKLFQAEYGSYPTALNNSNCPDTTGSPSTPADSKYCLKLSGSNKITQYTGTSSTFNLKIYNSTSIYGITESTTPTVVTIVSTIIQTVTSANCTSSRTRTVDARDYHTYWVQKLADGKCWMLTNLGYSGGGNNTYNDVINMTDGTGQPETYYQPKYYPIPGATYYTTEPNSPSTTTDGNGQYGYLYNYCAASGAQLSSAGCSASTSQPTSSVCPSGWRLPTALAGGDFDLLNQAINPSPSTGAGLLTSPYLGQLSGMWAESPGFSSQTVDGYYLSSTTFNNTSNPPTLPVAYYGFHFKSNLVSIQTPTNGKTANAVRCVAV